MIRKWSLLGLICLLFVSGRAQLLPPGLPQFNTVRHDNSLWCDYMFTEALNWTSPTDQNLALVFDAYGEVVWYTASNQPMTNFALQPNGLMSFFSQNEHLLLDSTFAIVGGLACQSFANDAHDLIMTADGRIFLICLELTNADLSAATTHNGSPGSTFGQLLTTVIQELDMNNNLVREWKALPHYQITDCDSFHFTVPNRLDLNHPNSIDWDGRYLLISHRHNNELLLLDWDAGQIVWRLGGPHNQFNIVNDTGTQGQHDARFTDGGKISVFDNGNYHPNPLTRGVIFQPDTTSMTVSVAAQYPASSLVSGAMGGFRVLPNGDVLRANGWFTPAGPPNISLIHANGQAALDLHFPQNYYCYRAQCFSPTWAINRPSIQCEPFGNGLRLYLDQSYPDYLWTTGETSASIVVQDTGRYQVFVPQGIGRMGSFEFHVPILNGSCPVVGTSSLSDPHRPKAKLIRTIDLLGREVRQRESNKIYIEVYSDGHTRKVIFRP